jgi:two-component system chemotaxis response regulator CheB
MKKTRVLIVDDSALVRRALAEIISTAEDLEVVGSAADPVFAARKLEKLEPDVLTLDVELPNADGIAFLAEVMQRRPMPVVLISDVPARTPDLPQRALALGAADFIEKPQARVAEALKDHAREIVERIRRAARTARSAELTKSASRRDRLGPERARAAEARAAARAQSADAILSRRPAPRGVTEPLIALGASTGGTEALERLLSSLPGAMPPIVIVQHISRAFSESFAERLDACSAATVRQVVDGDLLEPGRVYVAPGDRHLVVTRQAGRYVAQLVDGPPVNRHRPSVDVLFRSVAQSAGARAIGVLLTGMGDDGARGLGELRESGASTIAQDEATSAVWGMPGEAVRRGAAAEVLPLDEIGLRLERLIRARIRGDGRESRPDAAGLEQAP